MNWQDIELDKISDITSSKRIFLSDYVDDGIPFYRGKEIIQMNKGEDINLNYFITTEKFNEVVEKFGKPIGGDILLTAVGTLGYCYLVKDEDGDFYFKDGNLIWFRKISDKVSPKYLSLYFRTNFFQSKLNSIAIGSSQKALTIKAIKQLKIHLPPIPTQQKIASILSAYYDLIENNLKRIRLLEEAAQNIYKEWFVHFRFPDYENVEFENGLPKGWEKKTIKDFGKVVTGKTPSTVNANFYGGNIPFIKTPDMHGNLFVIDTDVKLTKDGADTQANKNLPPYSVLVSCIGTAGVVSLNAEESQTNQQINSIVFEDRNKSYYTYFYCKSIKLLLEGLGSNGATMVNVNKGKFENIEIIIPKDAILNEFANICTPIFSQILNLLYQNQKLKEARDILLPRLMNRTIEV